MSDDDRCERYTEAILKHFGHDRAGRSDAAVRQARGIAVAVSVARDEELEQLRYERRLLGAARMVLDLIADGDPARWEHARQEAGDIAQRIVDEIGHPVTDEPALGPGYRATIERLQGDRDALKVTNEQVRASLAAALAIWTPEHEYYQDRAGRKGYSHDETAAEVYGAAIKVVTRAIAALAVPGASGGTVT